MNSLKEFKGLNSSGSPFVEKASRHHAPCVPTLRVLRSLEEIRDRESQWKSLTREDAAPFQTFGWNLAWYREYADTLDEPLVFLLSVGEDPKAIVPCYRKNNEIRLAGDPICDYQDVIARNRNDATLALDMTWRWILRRAEGCCFRIKRASTEGWIHNILRSGDFRVEPHLHFFRYFAPCPVAETSGSLEDYLKTLPRKTRQDLRRSLKLLDRAAPRNQVNIRRTGEIERGEISALCNFHDEHFRKAGESPCRDSRFRHFLSAIAGDPEVGFQVATLVGESEELLAMDFGFAKSGRYFGYLTAFDLQYRKLAPGKCLLLRRLDSWGEKDQVSTIDFLSGDEAYKQDYSQGNQYEVYSHWLMPVTLGNKAKVGLLQSREFARKTRNRFRKRLASRKS